MKYDTIPSLKRGALDKIVNRIMIFKDKNEMRNRKIKSIL